LEVEKGRMLIRVVDEEGKPVSLAAVAFEGPETGQGTTGEEGKLEREMEPGSYLINVQKEGYLTKAANVVVDENSLADMEVLLSKAPTTSSVVIKKKRIVIKKKIHFATGSDEIKESSYPLLDEVASVLISHSELKKIQIRGHTDNRGNKNFNMGLSEKRAKSVLDYLVTAGVDSSRLDFKGYGPTKPIAPNITAQGRARNRRVEFFILEREESP
jgi:outer membrane protein OmpA-like peptidoglycan-associated protein